MMKKILMAAAAILLCAACAMFTRHGGVTLYAQTIPAVVHAQWDKPAATIKGDVSVGTGPYAVQDPRIAGKPRFNNVFRIVPFDGVSPAVAGPGGPAGGVAVADPRHSEKDYTTTKYKVTPFDGTARAVIGASTTGDGAFAVADPRGPHEADRLHGKYPVNEWGRETRAVIAGRDNGAFAVADPRPNWGNQRHQNILRVTPFEDHTGTIPAGVQSVTGGQPCVADPRRETYPPPTRTASPKRTASSTGRRRVTRSAARPATTTGSTRWRIRV